MAALNKMSVDYKSTFLRYNNLLNCVGLGPFHDSKGVFTWNNVKFLAFISTFSSIVVIQYSLLVKFSTNEFLDIAQAVPILGICSTDFLKVAILVFKREKIKTLLIEIGELWPKELERSTEQAYNMAKLLRRNNKWINLFYTFAFANMVTYAMAPLMRTLLSTLYGERNYVLPLQLPEICRLEKFPVYFAFYLYELIGTVPSQMCLCLPTDILLVVFCCNLSILFNVLQSDLRHAIQRSDGEITNRRLYSSDKESYDNIKRIVKTHQQLYRIARDVSDVFGSLLLIHMIFSSIIICFFGFLAIAYRSIAEKAIYLMTVFNVTLMIFILAIAGQLLYDASSDVAEAAYQSLWYASDVRVRKTMWFIITRAQQPVYLSALGYSDMTLTTFSKIMSSAWTYFNLLIQVFEDN